MMGDLMCLNPIFEHLWKKVCFPFEKSKTKKMVLDMQNVRHNSLNASLTAQNVSPTSWKCWPLNVCHRPKGGGGLRCPQWQKITKVIMITFSFFNPSVTKDYNRVKIGETYLLNVCQNIPKNLLMLMIECMPKFTSEQTNSSSWTLLNS